MTHVVVYGRIFVLSYVHKGWYWIFFKYRLYSNLLHIRDILNTIVHERMSDFLTYCTLNGGYITTCVMYLY